MFVDTEFLIEIIVVDGDVEVLLQLREDGYFGTGIRFFRFRKAVFRDLARVRALGRAERSSPSSRTEPESEPWVGRSGVRLWCLLQDLTACQSHSVKWHCSRRGAGGDVLLSGRSVERRSDGGHFGSAGGRTSG